MEDVISASMKALASYKEMIQDPEKCDLLCKDNECLMFLVYMLKDQEDEIIAESLNILLSICKTSHCSTVSTIFGLIPSINLLISSNQNRDIQILARKLQRLISAQSDKPSQLSLPLQDCQNQEFSLRTPTRPRFLGTANFRAKTVKLKIFGMESKAQRLLCEDQLVTVKGVISITFDVKKGYCIVRVRSDLKPTLLAEAVQRTKTMTAQEVVTNEMGEEVLVPLISSKNEGDPTTSQGGDLPPYLPEKDSPVKENAVVHRKRDFKKTTINLLASAADFLSRSLYW